MEEIQLQYIHDMCNIFYLTRQLITKISVLFIKMYIVTKLKKEALTKTPRHIYLIHFQAKKLIYNSFDSTDATKQTK